MSSSTGGAAPEGRSETPTHEVRDWADLGEEVWSFLTGRGAAVDYHFVDMTVEVPRDTGPDAPRATWKFDGSLRVTTSDHEFPGALGDPHTDR